MTVPAIVHERAGDEEVVARVPLGGDDELFVTSARTLLYRAEGLLSGESVEEYGHDAERIEVDEGRRKWTIGLDYGIDGTGEFAVPADRFDDAIEPILGGVFIEAGITEPGEAVADVYRLGELTLVITDGRVIKHVGNALWDEEYEEYPFERVTGIDVEQGSVSSQVIVEVDGRPQRVKTPSADARRIRERIQEGVLAYHDVATYEQFRRQAEAELEAEAAPAVETGEESGNDPQEADAVTEEPEVEATTAEPEEPDAGEPAGEDASDDGGDDGVGGSGMIFGEEVERVSVEGDDEDAGLADELAALRQAVERQNDLLRRHQRAIERLSRQLDAED